MQYLGRSARVPLGDGKWSPFMPIYEAQKLQHNLKVQRFLTMLRAGKQVIGLSDDIPAMYEAQDIYKKERESGCNTLTQDAQ